VKDSYSIIPAKLSSFPDMFGLTNLQKELLVHADGSDLTDFFHFAVFGRNSHFYIFSVFTFWGNDLDEKKISEHYIQLSTRNLNT
jgi:hypothetical protein